MSPPPTGHAALLHFMLGGMVFPLLLAGLCSAVFDAADAVAGLAADALAGPLIVAASTWLSLHLLASGRDLGDQAALCARSAWLNAAWIALVGVILFAGWTALHAVDPATPAVNGLVAASVALAAVSDAALFYVFSRTWLSRHRRNGDLENR